MVQQTLTHTTVASYCTASFQLFVRPHSNVCSVKFQSHGTGPRMPPALGLWACWWDHLGEDQSVAENYQNW